MRLISKILNLDSIEITFLEISLLQEQSFPFHLAIISIYLAKLKHTFFRDSNVFTEENDYFPTKIETIMKGDLKKGGAGPTFRETV